MIYPRIAENRYRRAWERVAEMLTGQVAAALLSDYAQREAQSNEDEEEEPANVAREAMLAAVAVLVASAPASRERIVRQAAERAALDVDRQVLLDATREAAEDGVRLPRRTAPARPPRLPTMRLPTMRPTSPPPVPIPAPRAPLVPRRPPTSPSRARPPRRAVTPPALPASAAAGGGRSGLGTGGATPIPPSPPNGPGAQDFIGTWIEGNVELIARLGATSQDWFRRTVREAYDGGWTMTRFAKEIEHAQGMTKRRAQLIARDQIGKLHGELTKHEALRVGVTEYIWQDSDDQRVRPKHEGLNNDRRRFDQSPIPGEEIQCRCTARPVWASAKTDTPLGPAATDLVPVEARSPLGAGRRRAPPSRLELTGPIQSFRGPSDFDWSGEHLTDTYRMSAALENGGIEAAVVLKSIVRAGKGVDRDGDRGRPRIEEIQQMERFIARNGGRALLSDRHGLDGVWLTGTAPRNVQIKAMIEKQSMRSVKTGIGRMISTAYDANVLDAVAIVQLPALVGVEDIIILVEYLNGRQSNWLDSRDSAVTVKDRYPYFYFEFKQTERLVQWSAAANRFTASQP